MNSAQDILTWLHERKGAVRKGEVVSGTGFSIHTVAKALAQLGRDGYVNESAGWYVITNKGSHMVKNELELLRFKSQREVLSNLPWRTIEKSGPCRHVIAIQEELRGNRILQIDLLPFVLMWLAASGKTLRRFDSEFEPDPEFGQILDQFFVKLYNLREDDGDS